MPVHVTIMHHMLTTLHERPDLLDDAARLLIQEWPRSLEARKASIQSSKDTLPCSLLLLANDRDVTSGTEKVVGFARLLEVVGDSSAALVESVVVEPSLRGQGLGRKLMEACEDHVMRLGITSMHLSTHDKQQFYHRLGYTDGPAKTGLRHSGKQIQNSLASVIASKESVRDNMVSPPEISSNQDEESSVITSNQVAAPPAPPPPPKIYTVANQEKTCITWMIKYLHSKCNS